jgi:hypothetical protein
MAELIKLTPEKKKKLMSELAGPKILERLGSDPGVDRQGLFSDLAAIVELY